MVHYKPVLERGKEEPYCREYCSDTYWMLGFYLKRTASEPKEHLAAHGYKYTKTANKTVLMEGFVRYQRGLLPYEKYDVAELRAFCEARNLSPPPKTIKASRLARILEKRATTSRCRDSSSCQPS